MTLSCIFPLLRQFLGCLCTLHTAYNQHGQQGLLCAVSLALLVPSELWGADVWHALYPEHEAGRGRGEFYLDLFWASNLRCSQNHYAFSPNPWFIAAFFSGQVILQAYWIRQLFKLSPAVEGYQRLDALASEASDVVAPGQANQQDEEGARTALSYAPVYALGNICIGERETYLLHDTPAHARELAGWLLYWQREHFGMSQVMVTINSTIQLLAVAMLPPLTESSSQLMRLTHYVAKTFAGVGVLDFLDNGGVFLVSDNAAQSICLSCSISDTSRRRHRSCKR